MRKSRVFNDLATLALLGLFRVGYRISLATCRWSAGLAQSSLIHTQHDFLDGRLHASLASLTHANNRLITLTDHIAVPFAFVIGFRGIGLGELDDLEWLGFPE